MTRFSRRSESNVGVLERQPLKPLETFSREAVDDPEQRERHIERLKPPLRGPARAVLAAADELASGVNWKASVLLERLGCDVATERDLDALTVEGLKQCKTSLKFVERGIALQDRMDHRRRAVRMFGTLFRQAEALTEPTSLRQALGEGPFSAWDYLALGEISAALHVASRAQRGTAGRLEPDRNPYAAAPTVHVSLPRLEAYVRNDARALGPNVLERIREHVEGGPQMPACEACREAAATVAPYAARA